MINFITISAPSGSGKTTLCKALRKVKSDIEWSVSYTTRLKRDSEKNGIDYHFITINKFEEFILNEKFVEWENVHGNYYGTAKDTLKAAVVSEKTLLLEMDVKGSMSIKKLYPDNTFSIFILPPSLEDLRGRLKKRGTDSDERIEIRLKRYQQEIEFQDRFDAVMINEDLESAKFELINIVNQLN
jgi:guanylate kinase